MLKFSQLVHQALGRLSEDEVKNLCFQRGHISLGEVNSYILDALYTPFQVTDRFAHQLSLLGKPSLTEQRIYQAFAEDNIPVLSLEHYLDQEQVYDKPYTELNLQKLIKELWYLATSDIDLLELLKITDLSYSSLEQLYGYSVDYHTDFRNTQRRLTHLRLKLLIRLYPAINKHICLRISKILSCVLLADNFNSFYDTDTLQLFYEFYNFYTLDDKQLNSDIHNAQAYVKSVIDTLNPAELLYKTLLSSSDIEILYGRTKDRVIYQYILNTVCDYYPNIDRMIYKNALELLGYTISPYLLDSHSQCESVIKQNMTTLLISEIEVDCTSLQLFIQQRDTPYIMLVNTLLALYYNGYLLQNPLVLLGLIGDFSEHHPYYYIQHDLVTYLGYYANRDFKYLLNESTVYELYARESDVLVKLASKIVNYSNHTDLPGRFSCILTKCDGSVNALRSFNTEIAANIDSFLNETARTATDVLYYFSKVYMVHILSQLLKYTQPSYSSQTLQLFKNSSPCNGRSFE